MFKRKQRDPEVQFIRSSQWPAEVPPPVRMTEITPSWWRGLSEFPEHADGFPTRTVKGCRPMLDALTAGWAMTLPQALHFKTGDIQPDGMRYLEWNWRNLAAEVEPIGTHGPGQLGPAFPFRGPYIKLIMAWGVKTPPGWSVMFQPLWLHDDLPFRPLPGVVDTDNYHAVVNLPCVWTADAFDGVIDAGTPVAQVIPFKRARWRGRLAEAAPGTPDQSNLVSMHESYYRKYAWAKKTWGSRLSRPATEEPQCPISRP